jgi:hypothetical protein
VLAAAALLPAAPAQAGARPILRATRVTPLAVAGAQFPRNQRIRVTATAGAASQARLVWTGALGRFSTSFTFRVDPCRTGAIVVARRLHSSAVLAELRIPAGKCPPRP